jgi:hypothetical protein
MGDYYLKIGRKGGLCHPLELDESYPKFYQNQIQNEVGDLQLEN